MPNIRVRARLERLSTEVEAIRAHVVTSSGVSASDAREIDNRCAEIIQAAARIAQEARHASGDQSYKTLIERVRKALGFTYP
jgi:TPP-dependent pyruvate/acetoin dehydrogenase alpha subunit